MAHSFGKKRAAFSLTELAVVLAVIGVLMGAIWTAATNVRNNNRANQAAHDIMQIAANIRSTYAATNTFPAAWSGANVTASMVAAGSIPTDLLNSSGLAQNVWYPTTNSVVIYVNPGCPLTTAGYNGMKVFRVSFYGTPADACYRIASQLANLGTHDGPIQLVTNSCGKTKGINTTGSTVGLSSSAITDACSANTTLTTSSTEFDFEIH